MLKFQKGKLIETKLDKFKQSFQSFKSFDYFKKTNFKKVISKSNIVLRQGQCMVKATRTTLTKTTVWWVLTQFKITLVYMTSIIVKICYIVILISWMHVGQVIPLLPYQKELLKSNAPNFLMQSLVKLWHDDGMTVV